MSLPLFAVRIFSFVLIFVLFVFFLGSHSKQFLVSESMLAYYFQSIPPPFFSFAIKESRSRYFFLERDRGIVVRPAKAHCFFKQSPQYTRRTLWI